MALCCAKLSFSAEILQEPHGLRFQWGLGSLWGNRRPDLA